MYINLIKNNMTPKEKAEALVNTYLLSTPIVFHIDDAKKCALMCVDEIISVIWHFENDLLYWQDVQTEIEKL